MKRIVAVSAALLMLSACQSSPAPTASATDVLAEAAVVKVSPIRVTIAGGEIRVGEEVVTTEGQDKAVIEPLAGALVRARAGADGEAVIDVVAEPQTPYRVLAQVIRTAEVAGLKKYRLGTVAVHDADDADITVTVTSAGYLVTVDGRDRIIPTRSGAALSHRLQVVGELLEKAREPGQAELGLIAHELLDDAQEEFDTATLYNLLASVRALRPDSRAIRVVADDEIPTQFVALTLDAIGHRLPTPKGGAFTSQSSFKLAQYASADVDSEPLFDLLVLTEE